MHCLSPEDLRMKIHKPTVEEVQASRGKMIPDVIGPKLRVLFCGINPGLYSAAVGCHFARPGNRFWPALRISGFTDRVLLPYEQQQLLDYGCGLTNLVARATATAAEIKDDELRAGRTALMRKIRRHKPKCVAILGIGAYRKAFRDNEAGPGLKEEGLSGAKLWVLPNPSGLNVYYGPDELARLFTEFREHVRGKRKR